MSSLIWRLFKKRWLVQYAVTLVIASVITVFAVYGAFINRESGTMTTRIENRVPENFFRVRQDHFSENRFSDPARTMYVLIAGWRNETVRTNVGDLPAALLDLRHGDANITKPGVAALSEATAKRLGLSIGDTLTLYRPEGPLELRMTDAFEDTVLGSGLDFAERVLIYTGEVQENNNFLYKRNSVGYSDIDIMSSIARHHADAHVWPAHHPDPTGSSMVVSNYSGIKQAKGTLILFVCLAFLTAKLMGFTDSRRMLAIIKALGLKRSEVTGVIAKEALLAPILGIVVGVVGSTVLLLRLASSGEGMEPTFGVLSGAVIALLPALAVGILVPSRLAGVASVNELLYERPIAMFRAKVNSLAKRAPGLDPLIERGVQFVKLAVIDGVFEGIILRKLGDTVQLGEPLALSYSWWGMRVKEYVAPIAGVVVYYQEDTGYIGIAPEDKAADLKNVTIEPAVAATT